MIFKDFVRISVRILWGFWEDFVGFFVRILGRFS